MLSKEELISELEKANSAYAAGIPYMTDSDYDIIWKQLYDIDPTNHLLYHTSQQRTNLVGKTFHKYPIFGTNKAFNISDLQPFFTRFGNQKLLIEPKYDGVAAVLTKTKHDWMLTLTGDGHCGADITSKMNFITFDFDLKHFQSIEIILPIKNWTPGYGKNPRNVVAGWLNRKYGEPDTMMTAIPHNFGPLSKEYSYDGDNEALFDLLINLHAEWSEIYPIDGLMLKVKTEKMRIVAGNNGSTYNWSIAWKPPIQIKETTITSIEWNVSRLGRLIPTIIYEPIDLCGTINTRATANNAKWLFQKQLQPGSKIKIGKAGEIIPKIITVDNSDLDITICNLPTICPICQGELSSEGVHITCQSPNCIAKLSTSIAYFYSDNGIKIDGIGEKIIEKLLQDTKIYEVLSNKIWALLDCTTYNLIADLIRVLGDKTFVNIFNNTLKVSNTKTMAHFISGLGLPGLGYKTALRLCQFLKTGELTKKVSLEARKNFTDAIITFQTAQEELKEFTFAPLQSTAKAKYGITGTLSMSRDAMIEFLSEYNYEFSAGVTKDTNYLLVGSEPGRVKTTKAAKYNIPCITEEQLFKILEKEKKDGS